MYARLNIPSTVITGGVNALIENSKIDFKASKSILLEANFEFNPGNEKSGVFTAQINGCE
jgi:hypothetical protein